MIKVGDIVITVGNIWVPAYINQPCEVIEVGGYSVRLKWLALDEVDSWPLTWINSPDTFRRSETYQVRQIMDQYESTK